MNKRTKLNSIRIIAGQWRGRRIPVLDIEGLRPTTNRVRETLFNWLMHDIAGAHCLDLFSGSGVLGLECLSRGAKHVDFVEKDKAVAENLQQSLQALLPESDVDKAHIHHQGGINFLNSRGHKKYDIVFIDPPFKSALALESIELLSNNNCLNDNALVYLEQDSHDEAISVPDNWVVHREGKAGQSAYFVYCVAGIGQT